ncbi:MAG: DUF819 family protein [Flavobacteriaceae bacterium]|nr:DUF819 family protein [Flavobacteriaceae bacterium]MDG2414731.1 DUF819 family protein [Flavobacteriaceae bacterium]
MSAAWVIALFTIVAVYFLDKSKNKVLIAVFDWIPAVLLAYVIPALISYFFSVDFSVDSIHSFSKTWVIPMAIVAVMSSLSFSQLKTIGFKPVVLFVIGSAIIALFPVVFAWAFLDSDLVQNQWIQAGYWKGIPPIVGSWIGGSTSQLVLKELARTSESLFLQVLVVDTVLVNIWTICMFQIIKKSQKLNTFFNISDKTIPLPISEEKGKSLPWYGVLTLLISGVFLIEILLNAFVIKVIALSIIGLLVSNFIPRWNYRFALKLGGVLIIVVMAILGLKLQFTALSMPIEFIGFLVFWIFVHFIGMVLAAKFLNVHLAWVPIASMANVGGIATAPAVTAAYEKKWMPHAIVLAILSMATGTFWGMITIYLFESLFKV